jgi:hypothetical protein
MTRSIILVLLMTLQVACGAVPQRVQTDCIRRQRNLRRLEGRFSQVRNNTLSRLNIATAAVSATAA